jgi:hypothetical protein
VVTRRRCRLGDELVDCTPDLYIKRLFDNFGQNGERPIGGAGLDHDT